MATNILNKFPANMGKRDAYRLTKAQDVNKMQTLTGATIAPERWVLFEDPDPKTGEIKTVLVIESNGEKFGTISKTFIDAFIDAAEEFGEDLGEITVVGGKSKAGRDFITCEII